jgi:hypothetical protein
MSVASSFGLLLSGRLGGARTATAKQIREWLTNARRPGGNSAADSALGDHHALSGDFHEFER